MFEPRRRQLCRSVGGIINRRRVGSVGSGAVSGVNEYLETMQPPPRKVGPTPPPHSHTHTINPPVAIPGKLRQIPQKPPRGADQQTQPQEPPRVRTARGHQELHDQAVGAREDVRGSNGVRGAVCGGIDS